MSHLVLELHAAPLVAGHAQVAVGVAANHDEVTVQSRLDYGIRRGAAPGHVHAQLVGNALVAGIAAGLVVDFAAVLGSAECIRSHSSHLIAQPERLPRGLLLHAHLNFFSRYCPK